MTHAPVAVRSAQTKALDLPLHRQQATEWCWAAVAQCVELFFNPHSDLRQCKIVSRGFRKACCGADFSPVEGRSCNRSGFLHEALERLGLLAKPTANGDEQWIQGPASFETVRHEIDRGRPVCVLIKWRNSGGLGHFIVLEGYAVTPEGNRYVFVRNPLSPKSSSQHPYELLASQSAEGGYQDGQGVWAYSFLVKPPGERI